MIIVMVVVSSIIVTEGFGFGPIQYGAQDTAFYRLYCLLSPKYVLVRGPGVFHYQETAVHHRGKGKDIWQSQDRWGIKYQYVVGLTEFLQEFPHAQRT